MSNNQGISPGAAAILSLLIPGLGQLCQGRIIAGPFWFFLCLFGYLMLILPGLFFHVLTVMDAAWYRS